MSHLSDDQLLDHMLGLADAGAHLGDCDPCRRRFRRMEARRAILAAAPQMPAQLLHRQRRAVLARAEQAATHRRRALWLWAPAAAVFVTVMVWLGQSPRQAPEAAAEIATPSGQLLEASWFEETYSILEDHEPRAALPIRHLFDEEAQ